MERGFIELLSGVCRVCLLGRDKLRMNHFEHLAIVQGVVIEIAAVNLAERKPAAKCF